MGLFSKKKNEKVEEKNVVPTNIDEMTDKEIISVVSKFTYNPLASSKTPLELPKEYFENERSAFIVLDMVRSSLRKDIFQRFSDELKHNKPLLLKIIREINVELFNYFPEEYKNEKSFLLDALKAARVLRQVLGLNLLTARFPKEKEFLLEAIKIYPAVLDDFPELTINKKFVLEAFRLAGPSVLSYANKKVFYDPTFQKELQEVSDERVDDFFNNNIE